MSAFAVCRLEIARLRGQRRAAVALAGCALLPPLFLAGLSVSSGLPTDTLFGRQLHDTGYATPLFLLTFCGAWVLPLLAAVYAGDAVSAEHDRGTWQLLVGRVSRSAVLGGKALAAATCSLALVVLLAASSILSGVVATGTGPLLDLSGDTLPAGRVGALVVAAWATVLMPVLAYAALALLLSVWSRSSAAGLAGTVVVGLVLQLATQVASGPARGLLLPTAFSSWHGLLLHRPSVRPVLDGVALSFGWGAAFLLLAWYRLLRDDRPSG